jgi:pyruvate formate lyase activating enzyme
MIIGGLQRFSLIDYPGRSCAVLFTVGCNFRCRYCHNPELIVPERYPAPIPFSQVRSFLERRRGKLEAVCITGGEPTEHPDLPEMMAELRGMGFLVKLDTNGSRPEMLADLLTRRLVDYIAMDVKAPLDKYMQIVCRSVAPERVEKSIELLLCSDIQHEFRTTVAQCLTSKEDLERIAQTIRGAKRYFLQRFVARKLQDPVMAAASSYPDHELKELTRRLEQYVGTCSVR